MLWPLGLLIRGWSRTLRFDISEQDRRTFEKRDVPVVFMLWHNRLFLAPECYRRYRNHRPIYALISASRDGAWLAAFFSLIGMRAVRGSSSRFGREAAGLLVDVLREGRDVGVTPDGPRGPCYDFKPGAVVVAQLAGAPVLLFGAEYHSAWRLRSWDGFYLPVPFSRVRLRCEQAAAGLATDRDSSAQAIAARLRQINPD